jgi:hypothetical protein
MLVYHVGYPTLLVSDVQQVPVATAWPYLARESMVVKKKIGGSEKKHENLRIPGKIHESLRIFGVCLESKNMED